MFNHLVGLIDLVWLDCIGCCSSYWVYYSLFKQREMIFEKSPSLFKGKQTAIDWLIGQAQDAQGETGTDVVWLKLTFKDIEVAKLLALDELRAVHLLTYMDRDMDIEKFLNEQE